MAEQTGDSNCWVDLLGPQLLKNGKQVKTADCLKGKFVALYFSAHWCGPCRGFTPVLVKQYKKIVDENKKNWEVVFCSSDSDQSAFESYFKEMPWCALPYAERDLKSKLSSKYKVRGIPTLVLLNTEGELITDGGRSKVMDADSFPWLPIPFEKCFPKVLKGSDMSPVGDFDIMKGVKALYFSAHWCGPCRNFTPMLTKAYQKLSEENRDFEIVFVTSDKSEPDFKNYFADMPWACLPFDCKEEISSLEDKFGVEGIPSLVVLQDGKLLNPSAVGDVRSAGGDPFDAAKAAAEFPWKQKAVLELSRSTAEFLNEYPCLILFQEKDVESAVQTTNASFLQKAAEVELENSLSGKERKMAFYTHNKEVDITPLLKKMMTEIDAENKMVILHFGGQLAYYVADLPSSEADVTKFVADFHAGKLERKQAVPPR